MSGLTTLVGIASVIEYVFLSGDLSLMPLLVIPGIFALVIGLVILGIGVFRSGVLPRWVAVLLVMGALAMLGSNEQTALELLLVPLGIA